MRAITASSGAVTVTFILYGDISEARLQTETFLCQRRANQLGHVPEKRRGWTPRAVADDSHDDF